MEKRETRYRVQWYYRLFQQTQQGLSLRCVLPVAHGSLLALGELLQHTGQQPRPPFTERFQALAKRMVNKQRISGCSSPLLSLSCSLCQFPTPCVLHRGCSSLFVMSFAASFGIQHVLDILEAMTMALGDLVFPEECNACKSAQCWRVNGFWGLESSSFTASLLQQLGKERGVYQKPPMPAELVPRCCCGDRTKIAGMQSRYQIR